MSVEAAGRGEGNGGFSGNQTPERGGGGVGHAPATVDAIIPSPAPAVLWLLPCPLCGTDRPVTRVPVPSLADDPEGVDDDGERRAGLKWLNDALERGDGAFVFSVTENGNVGVFRDGADEHTPALGVGYTAADALDDAAFRAAESARSTGEGR